MTPESITIDGLRDLETELRESIWKLSAIISLAEDGIYSPTMAAERINQIMDNLRAAAQ